MARINLNVPFSEKDEAKQLGARWDATLKVWFVPDGVDSSAFGRWLPTVPDVNIRSQRYGIAQTETVCWKCDELTRVYGFVLPPGHQTVEQDEDGVDEWYEHDSSAMALYVTDLPPTVIARLKPITRHYYVDFSKTTNSSYWMNHCENCGMKQGDFAIYCEPGGAFFPMDEYATSKISLQSVHEPFCCNGDAAYGGLFEDN
ncbi:DUF5710 domain-containing protein [Janthinobacterium sp. SUN033]|uniref:DUF5710 domain-containing protein n=1 Tax=Janthinobacterium sp. SUN033 TaxID=3002439 RepID=UPI0025B262E0|nr:DUF5710 domain-containing protein [Janthinobacterium sp. SUN033]MDN2677946.1 DUF5710 domain-containing protein [Janthinobacterium sp. SUN033]